jgi:ubiquinol-cytochrome c reductase cytochrome c1 subunit
MNLMSFRNLGLKVGPGQHYNPYFPGDLTAFWSGSHDKVPRGGLIAMAPPLAKDKVSFDDGTPSTIENQGRDVAAFLTWASEPKLEERKAFGLGAMIYLVIFSGLLWFSYRRIWRNVGH